MAYFYLLAVLLLLFSVFLVPYVYARYLYRYWKKLGIPYVEPTFPSGNLQTFLYQKQNLGQAVGQLYRHFKNIGAKFGGIFVFFEPVLMVVDQKLIKNIFVSDFKHFVDHSFYVDEERDPLSAHLFALRGQKWRNLRVKLSPVFTTGRMKLLFPKVESLADRLVKVLSLHGVSSEPANIQEIITRYATDSIATCAYGVNCNSLENTEDEFFKSAKRLFEVRNFSDHVRRLGLFTFSYVINLFRIKFAPKQVDDFFMKMVNDVVEYREKTKALYNDFMDLLIELKNVGFIKGVYGERDPADKSLEKLTLEQMAAQCLIIFIGGYDTSSSTLAFLFYELAKDQSIQDKLRKEIVDDVEKHGGNVTYESLKEIKYLDMVINETLRKYCVIPLLTRICTEDYPIPDGDYIIKKGQTVYISVVGIHNDPEYYPNPERFDPERFSEENKASIPHFAYIPFGEGPRLCIGKRFGYLQMRLAIVKVLMSYKIVLNPKTVEPVVVKPLSMVNATPHTDVFLNFVKISD